MRHEGVVSHGGGAVDLHLVGQGDARFHADGIFLSFYFNMLDFSAFLMEIVSSGRWTTLVLHVLSRRRRGAAAPRHPAPPTRRGIP